MRSCFGGFLRNGFLGRLGAVLGRLGAVLGPLGAVLKSSWGRLGADLGRLGVVLGLRSPTPEPPRPRALQASEHQVSQPPKTEHQVSELPKDIQARTYKRGYTSKDTQARTRRRGRTGEDRGLVRVGGCPEGPAIKIEIDFKRLRQRLKPRPETETERGERRKCNLIFLRLGAVLESSCRRLSALPTLF